MPHSGHLIVGSDCRFHLNTYVDGYIISTVGEWWPERRAREIHAQIHDPKFDYEEIGAGRKYETMVFKAKKSNNKCCAYTASNWEALYFDGYNAAYEAVEGHYKMCEEWAKEEQAQK